MRSHRRPVRPTPITATIAVLLAAAVLTAACTSPPDDGESVAAASASTSTSTTVLAEDHAGSEEPHTHTDDGEVVDLSSSTDTPGTDLDTSSSSTELFDTIDLADYLAAYDESNDNVDIVVANGTITISGNGLPNFETGDFPNAGNPNSISAQNVDVSITADPVWVGTPTAVREPGVSLAGIKFEPGTAERDPETGAPIEAFQSLLDLGLDLNNAHVQPDGTYHFHGDPTALSEGDSTTHSNLVGFMHDGFPVYVLYGFGDADTADGTVMEITSSWQMKVGERSDDEPAGTYDGTYTTDFEFVEGSGELDECNGMFTVTPEYPEGTYAYFITDTFPYISRCLMGEPSAAATAPPTGPPVGRP